MTITIELPADLEQKLREQARRSGVSVEQFVIDILSDRFLRSDTAVTNGCHPVVTESELRLAISRGPSEAERIRYQELVKLRRDETLTAEQHAELIRLSDMIEVAHAARLEKVLQLAALRHVPFQRLMDDLGISIPLVGEVCCGSH